MLRIRRECIHGQLFMASIDKKVLGYLVYTCCTALNMMSKNSPSSAALLGSMSASSSLSQPVDNTHQRLPRSDAEKLDMLCNYMRATTQRNLNRFARVEGKDSASRLYNRVCGWQLIAININCS